MVIKSVLKFIVAVEITVLFFAGCKQEVKKKSLQVEKTTTNILLTSFFKEGLDSILKENNKNTIIFANNFIKDSLNEYRSNQNNLILFTDTLTFNKILKDSILLKLTIPIYVKSILDRDTSSLLLFKHNKEAIYTVRFKNEMDGKLTFIDNSITYVKFRYALPFNN